MIRYEEFMKKYAERFAGECRIDSSEFSDIPLYADQVIAFFNEKRKVYGEESGLTRTQLAGYVRSGMLPPPTDKKYGKSWQLMAEFVLLLLSAYDRKDVDFLMKPFIENEKSHYDENYDFTELYDKLMPLFEKQSQKVTGEMDLFVNDVKVLVRDMGIDDDTLEIFILLLLIASRVDAESAVGTALLRAYFSDVEK